MILSKDEAVCVVLGFAVDNVVSSPTKLNKLLARLNLHFIPIDIDFDLNKYGSFNADLNDLVSNEYYKLESYEYNGSSVNKFILKSKGKELFDKVIHNKLNKILSEDDLKALNNEIHSLSKLPAREISDNEHKKLLVDVDDRHMLLQKVNIVLVEMTDLYDKIEEISSDSSNGIRLRALIEYCYFLARHLKKKFDSIGEKYDFEAYMFDYYFLYHIHIIIPFLTKQIKSKERDVKKINKYYQYIINSVKDKRYPFSLGNPDLHKLIAS